MSSNHIKKSLFEGCKTEDHKNWNRRSFLQAMGLVGGGTMAFANASLSAAMPSPLAAAINNAETDRILILIRLKGGNDGLNTIVPMYDYDTYKKERPKIGFDKNQVFSLNEDFAMPNYAAPLEKMWGDGKMKVIHGVGYENQTRSHFGGHDRWASTDHTGEIDTGWFGRYFEDKYPDYLVNPPAKPAALMIGQRSNNVFTGDNGNYAFAVSNPQRLYEIAKDGQLYNLNNLPGGYYGEQIKFIKGVFNTTFSYAGVLNEAFTSSNDFGGYADNSLGNQLSIISRMIKGNLGTKIYMVTLDGFDTHGAQPDRHANLISELSETIANFYADMKQAGLDQNILSFTFSEFGRRIAENASLGTGHGLAGPMLFFGPALEDNGFIGKHPDLSDTTPGGDLKYHLDFRDVYATVLKEWLCVDPVLVDKVMLDRPSTHIPIGFKCSGVLSNDDFSLVASGFQHSISNAPTGETFLNIETKRSHHMVIKLYTLLGQEVGVIKNGMMTEGTHQLSIEKATNSYLDSGIYLYRIQTNDFTVSDQFMIT